MINTKVLFIDDEENVLNSITRLFRKEEDYELIVTADPKEALSKISNDNFAVVVSDQRMPTMDGVTFLEKVKDISPDTIRIIMTGQMDIQSAIKAINNGAVYKYLTKPWNDDELKNSIRQAVFQYHLITENKLLQDIIQKQNVELREFNESLEKKIEERTKEIILLNKKLENSFLGSIRLMSELNEMHSPVFGNHAKRVTALSKEIARMMEISEQELIEIEVGAAMHDIGKIGISPLILNKKDELRTVNERSIYHTYVLKGEKIAQLIPDLKNAPLFIRHHHENYDGTGYPDRLKGNKIPLGARIIAIVNAFDVFLNSKNDFHKSTPETALHQIKLQAGKYFDPAIVKVFESWLQNHLLRADLGHEEIEIPINDLAEGMILSKPIQSSHGYLLSKNTLITEKHIQTIKSMQETDPIEDKVYIYRKTK